MFEIKFPEREDLKIENWFIGEGETIKRGEPLLSLRSGREFFNFEAPFDGILYKRLFENGAAFEPDDVIGLFVDFDEIGELKIKDQMTKQDLNLIKSLHLDKKKLKERVHLKATPSARRKAREEQVDLKRVRGTGPDGRIQLKDVTNFMVKEREELLKRHKKPEEVKAEYGLPLSPLALRLANKHHLDIQKIPAPPGSMKIRKQDVERYLRNPEGAEQEILNNIKKEKLPPALPQVTTYTELQEPATPGVIRLSTEETSTIPSSEKIELSTDYNPVYLEGTSYPQLASPKPTVIRLYSNEESIGSGPVILLPGADTTIYISPPKENVKVEQTPKEKISLFKSAPTVHLAGVIESQKSLTDMLGILYQVLSKRGFRDGYIYTRYLTGRAVAITSDDVGKIKEALDNGQQADAEKGSLVVVDLLELDLYDVSGLIDPKDKMVLYLESGKEDRDVIDIDFEYDSAVMEGDQAVLLLQAVMDFLEDDDRGDQ